MQYSDAVLIPNSSMATPTMIPLHKGLVSKSIHPETCERYRCYSTGVPFEVVYQYTTSYKYRKGGWTEETSRDKEVRWYGERSLFGEHLWTGEPLPVYICEGETDAMRLSQHVTHGYCLALGGNPDKEKLNELRDTLLRFAGDNPITVCFDDDKAGKALTQQLAKLLGSKVGFVLDLPPGIKDICQLDPEVEPTFVRWPKLPHNLSRGTDVLKNITLGTDGRIQIDYRTTGFKLLDNLIGGWSKGGMIMLLGHPKNGKSSLANHLTLLYTQNYPDDNVLVIPLEMTQEETLGFAGGSEIQHVAERTYFVRHFGMLTASEMGEYLAVIPTLGITHVVIDHITAACTSPTDGLQTKLIDSLLYSLQAACLEYGVSMCVVSHVSLKGTLDGTIAADAGRGSYAIAQIPLCVLGVQLQESTLSRVYTITRHRYTGKSGSIYLDYDEKTHRYKEQDAGFL